jgi:hypothetical protein|uniref:YvlB/LiaX N-terminal domain-containing protein n=1 Tax=candidate division WOR-3 bacterium TaxID=2052148 RepID=A0A7C6AAU5_UNCW3
MSEERMKILKMLEAKKITAEEAGKLLDALREPTTSAGKFLKVKVWDKTKGKSKVNVTVPLSLVKWGMKFVPEKAQVKLKEQNIDITAVSEAIEKEIIGKIVEVDDEDKGEHIEVDIE